MSCMIFNLPFDLVSVNDCRLMGTFSVFPIKIATSEPIEQLMNITLIYGTICINGTYLFAVCTVVFSFAKIKHQMTKCISFSCIFFYFNLKTFKIRNIAHESYKKHIEMSPFRICINMTDFSHVWNKIVCSKPSIEKCCKPLFQSIILGWVMKTLVVFFFVFFFYKPPSFKPP